MGHGNNQIANNHFKKDWQNRVKTWFDQAARKKRRRLARVAKALRTFPRPVEGSLRPIVHGTSLKYNTKLRAGRGFTLAELKEAGLSANVARTIGIAVDHRRHNNCLESLQLNAQRLKAYRSKLVVFPRNASKPKKTDGKEEELKTPQQHKGALLPFAHSDHKQEEEARAITDAEKKRRAFYELRQSRADVKYFGARKKAAAARAAAAAEKANK